MLNCGRRSRRATIHAELKDRQATIVAERPWARRLPRAGVELKPCWVMTVGDHDASRLHPKGIVACGSGAVKFVRLYRPAQSDVMARPIAQ